MIFLACTYFNVPPIYDDLHYSCVITRIDYSKHVGSHPTLGVVDNICISALYPTPDSLQSAVNAARELGSQIYTTCHVPIYFYGQASMQGSRLRDLRRGLGYFTSSTSTTPPAVIPSPEYGSSRIDVTKGRTCIGSITPLIVNLNLRYASQDRFPAVRQVAQRLRGVDIEALTLKHDGCFEVACNLLHGVSPSSVQERAERIAEECALGVTLQEAYSTAPTAWELLQTIQDRRLYAE
jgi:glutamate formiminotransferase